MMRCACGYVHDGHCPLCACGEVSVAHTFENRCPGKPPNEAGRYLTLRRGQFRTPPDAPVMRRRADGSLVPVTEAPTEVVEQRPPLVPARYTQAFDEIAPRAMPLGKQAAALGWQVDPWYWREAGGAEVSVLVMQRGELRAYAVWRGRPWRTDGAHAWRLGQFPQAVGVNRLLELIKEIGESE